MPKKGAEVVDIEVQVLHETEKAWLVCSGITGKDAWVPKSQAECEDSGGMILPTWLAQEKGLI